MKREVWNFSGPAYVQLNNYFSTGYAETSSFINLLLEKAFFHLLVEYYFEIQAIFELL